MRVKITLIAKSVSHVVKCTRILIRLLHCGYVWVFVCEGDCWVTKRMFRDERSEARIEML